VAAIEEIARLVATGQLRVPIAASFPVEQILAAVELQAGRHVHRKVVIDLQPSPSAIYYQAPPNHSASVNR
jgi:NADPH:quinone reductase-like Zn-dependent oxidoreductase